MQEKQSIIVRASGEAKAAELVGMAVRQNKGFLSLRRLEAARDIANMLAQSDNKVMLDAQTLLLNGDYFLKRIHEHALTLDNLVTEDDVLNVKK